MSPEYEQELNTAHWVRYALVHGKDINPVIEELKSRYACSIEGLAWIIYRDDWVLDEFKRAWHNPKRELTKLDEILVGKVFGE